MRQAVEALNEMDPEQLKRLFREVRQHRLEADTQMFLHRLHSHQNFIHLSYWACRAIWTCRHGSSTPTTSGLDGCAGLSLMSHTGQ